MGGYIVKLLAAVLLSGIILQIVGKKSPHSGVIKLLCGVFVTLAAVSPWTHFTIDSYMNFHTDFTADAQQAVASGEVFAKEMRKQIILEQTTSYILDKAKTLGAELEVDITFTDGDMPTPCRISITGSISPYAKRVLSAYIADNLDIPPEEQQWIS